MQILVSLNLAVTGRLGGREREIKRRQTFERERGGYCYFLLCSRHEVIRRWSRLGGWGNGKERIDWGWEGDRARE